MVTEISTKLKKNQELISEIWDFFLILKDHPNINKCMHKITIPVSYFWTLALLLWLYYYKTHEYLHETLLVYKYTEMHVCACIFIDSLIILYCNFYDNHHLV